ncbi:FAD-dependent oxidoreductase [Aliiroseovarius sp. M344]|uniref:FAD-dependent oxidoreductase n=1 Tax=Aliiroseovarius sp. M344 TaxID=2867010 RepID=UPI0021ADA50D|nr:FAD-dependent oxidoreductase [Aliiroseovarius sp. M344]UWQ15127.1 FAD-dependent oxidoreductase [Aliiroseovarius sp. M344]
MLDKSLLQEGAVSAVETYELVVVGAGIAGLNALNAASEYLTKDARVLLLDQKDAPGGMWNTAYDYVRLHQPHPMFTVGNMKWRWQKPHNYLATRDEVQSHLANSLGPIGDKVDLQTRFGQTVERCTEVETCGGPMAEVVFHPNGAKDGSKTVYAKRAIHAPGLNYVLAKPLEFSSKNVISIIPQDLRTTLAERPNVPVIIVGGGKTGMDSVLATLAADPARNISLINGRGTNFFNRTKYIPTGLKRWTSGMLASQLFRDVAMAFDGDNEDHTLSHLRKNHSTDPASDNDVFLYGLQSEEELAKIKAGVARTHADYLVDVTDTPDGPQMLMRSRAKASVADGSIFVNCTGSFFRSSDLATPIPILSPNNCVLSINSRDTFHFLTSVSGFFTTHLLYRSQMRRQGFYTVDLEALFRKNRNAWVGASAAQAYMNQVVAVQTLPLMLLDRCGLDLDRWYPLPRRIAGLLTMKANATRDIEHCRRCLDRVAERFDVHAKPFV